MPGIGDYVHLHYENYRKYGINRSDSGLTISNLTVSQNEALANAHTRLKEIYNTRQEKINTEYIADYLTFMVYGMNQRIKNPSNLEGINEQRRKIVMDNLTKALEEKWPNLILNMKNLSFGGINTSQLDAVLANLGIKKYLKTTQKSVEYNTLAQLRSVINDTIAKLNDMQKLIGTTGIDAKEIAETLKQLESYSDVIEAGLNAAMPPESDP